MSATLTPYELERLENIRKNKQLLDDLGISGSAGPVQPKVQPNTTPKRSAKRKRESFYTLPSIEQTRKSARLANGKASDSPPSPEPIQTGPGPSHIILRKLTPPTIPQHEAENFDTLSRAPLPQRDSGGTLRFDVETYFTPNLTPAELLSMGSFGGTAFRSVNSKILRRVLSEDDYREFPASWFDELDVPSLLTRTVYDPSVNKYKVKAGQSLEEWEAAGWIRPQDPRGWFQWYCRFYLGRRTLDDERQIKRWLGVCGPSGRFKRSLVKKIAESGTTWDDASVSPVIRQTLQHWGYKLTEEDYAAYLQK